MAKHKILVRESVYKDTARTQKKYLQRIIKAISDLTEELRPPQSRKLSGKEKYRLRCGSYRVIYEIRDTELIISVARQSQERSVCSLGRTWHQDFI